jgi:hypothetical protein
MELKLNATEKVLVEVTADKVGMTGSRGSTGKFIVTNERIFYYPRISISHDEIPMDQISGYKLWKVLWIMETGFTIILKSGKQVRYASRSRSKIIEVLKEHFKEIE